MSVNRAVNCANCGSPIESIATEYESGTSGRYQVEFRWRGQCGSLTQLGAYGNPRFYQLRIPEKAKAK